MKNIKTIYEDFTKENKNGYIITGESGINRGILYFVNDEEGITAYSKDMNKIPKDLEKKKVFVDRKSAEKFKKRLINWRYDVRWYIDSK